MPPVELKIITARSIQQHPGAFVLVTYLCRRLFPPHTHCHQFNVAIFLSLGDHCRSGVTCLISIRSLQKIIAVYFILGGRFFIQIHPIPFLGCVLCFILRFISQEIRGVHLIESPSDTEHGARFPGHF